MGVYMDDTFTDAFANAIDIVFKKDLLDSDDYYYILYLYYEKRKI